MTSNLQMGGFYIWKIVSDNFPGILFWTFPQAYKLYVLNTFLGFVLLICISALV